MYLIWVRRRGKAAIRVLLFFTRGVCRLGRFWYSNTDVGSAISESQALNFLSKRAISSVLFCS